MQESQRKVREEGNSPLGQRKGEERVLGIAGEGLHSDAGALVAVALRGAREPLFPPPQARLSLQPSSSLCGCCDCDELSICTIRRAE